MRVSMPSRAYTSLLRNIMYLVAVLKGQLCQCPLGLIPHCYERWRELKESQLKCVNALSGLYLIVTRKLVLRWIPPTFSVNALSGLYLIVTVPLQKPRFYAISRAYFCRYLSEYSDSNCFSCMLTI